MKSSKTIRPVSFELMQYFYGTVHEPLIHAYLQFAGSIDEQTLIRAVTASIAYVPLLECVFSPDSFRPRWVCRGFTGADLVRVETIDLADLDVKTNSILTRVLSVESEPPLRLTLLKAERGDRLCVVISHLVCDGAGFKQYLYLLSQLYSNLCSGTTLPIAHPSIRSSRRLFRPMKAAERIHIFFSRYDGLTQPRNLRIPMEGDPARPQIRTLSISSDRFTALKRYARAQGATINDVLLTAYARVLARETGISAVSLPCPADLRKYLPASDSLSICNLTTNYVVNVEIAADAPFLETLQAVSAQLSQQKASNACLKSVVLVGLAFHLIPFRWMERLFPKLFAIPVTSYTNLGILEAERLCFGEASATGALLTGAIKYSPYFQVSVSSSQQTLTLSCNLYGTANDSDRADALMQQIDSEWMQAI